MIRHAWSVLCQLSSIDSESKNVSLMSVVEQLSVDSDEIAALPTGASAALPSQLELVTLWYRDPLDEPATGNATLRLVDANGDQMAEFNYPINLSVNRRTRSRAKLGGLPFSGYGIYRFVVSLDGAEVASIPVEIATLASLQADQAVSENL